MIDILNAARYLIYLSYSGKQYSLTMMKLQKLLYLAQGWSFVWDDCPIFADTFFAWGYGPINEKVYEAFKIYGRDELPENEGSDQISDKIAKETLEAIWRQFGEFSAYTLAEITCSQRPWKQAYKNEEIITADSIRNYFRSVYCS